MRFSTDFAIKAEDFYGRGNVFRTMRSAAEGLGVSVTAIYHAYNRKSLCKGYTLTKVPRLFVVKTTDGEYLVCRREKDKYIVMGPKVDVIYPNDVVVVREVTENMWNGQE